MENTKIVTINIIIIKYIATIHKQVNNEMTNLLKF